MLINLGFSPITLRSRLVQNVDEFMEEIRAITSTCHELVGGGEVLPGDEPHGPVQPPHPPPKPLVLPAHHRDDVTAPKRQFILGVRVALPLPVVQVSVILRGIPGGWEGWGLRSRLRRRRRLPKPQILRTIAGEVF